MPATEQIWRNPKVMHAVFGATSVVMLIATVWMFADDHAAEYKRWQAEAVDLDQWTARARILEKETTAYRLDLIAKTAALLESRSLPIDRQRIEDFQILVTQDAERLDVGDGSEPDFAPLDQAVSRLDQLADQADDAEEALAEVVAAREAVLAELARWAKAAKLREDNLTTAAKAEKANFNARFSERDILVGRGDAAGEARLQAEVESLKQSVAQSEGDRDAAKDHRTDLESIIRSITAEENAAQKALDALASDLDRLHEGRHTAMNKFGDWVLRLPILDAFYTGDRKIDPGWLPDLTIDINFRDVARFDRCATCHQSINKSAPGAPNKPAYDADRLVTLTLSIPDEKPPEISDGSDSPRAATLLDVYGIQLAPAGGGRLNSDDVTVLYTLPETRGARAGLRMGDVLEEIAGGRVFHSADVDSYLLQNVAWGEPIELKIRRGVPQPFASHPRLDLFVGSTSPHKKEEMGCTICHDGQGGATEFRWASHMPDNPTAANRWYRDRGWFDNSHWIFPMLPNRFVESGCLKCHHDVAELEPSERFPDPPAPKLLSGYHLIRDYGCYGCHEINGYDGPDKRIGPDLRIEPNYAPAAQAVLTDAGITEEEHQWASRLVHHPDDDRVRRQLVISIEKDESQAALTDAAGSDEAPAPRLNPDTHKLGKLLQDVEAPGQFRKAGPSLRHVASKVDFEFLYDWIRDPRHFRPSTRMPQFFGQWQHLDEGEGLEEAQKFEPIEIRAIAKYLLDNSQPFEYLPPVAGTAPASAERGKLLFQTRGCLACHTHGDFPGIAQVQGPDLSRVGAKFNTEKGRRWLTSWIRQPDAYHARTRMPNLFLDPITEEDGTVTDPAADIVAYLSESNDWQPAEVPEAELTPAEQAALADLALEHLSGSFPVRRAEEYLKTGIPGRFADRLKDAEKTLLETAPGSPVERQLRYVGEQSVNKYGCFGCHDIPGFETAKPIGTALADWGRKESSKLAFEQIAMFLATHGIDGKGKDGHESVRHSEVKGGHGHGLDPFDEMFDDDQGYYLQALAGHHREGFIWQKLRLPRSYDYKKTKNKGYNERLRMPKFTFNYREGRSAEENAQADKDAREAVITFVLGLVNEPPAEKYIYHADPRRKAIVDGLHVLDKYNCGGCHTLQNDRWEFDYRATTDEQEGDFDSADEFVGFPFLAPRFSPKQIQQSLKLDIRGRRHAVVYGQPDLDDAGNPIVLDEEEDVIEEVGEAAIAYRRFTLFQNALIDGQVRLSGVETLSVPEASLTRYPPVGGHLARYLFPVVIADEMTRNPQVKGSEAWSWLPPPLASEGQKVQTDWLHDFLLDPYRIRPAAVMRMPKFNMSSAEARTLANYFAALDDADYPYEFNRRRRDSYLASVESQHAGFLDDAMKIVIDKNYCVQCHVMGDFRPQGSVTAMGPDLTDVYRRFRPDWLRRWLANPKRIISYTGMPQNVPYKDESPHFGGVSQDLFPGSSTEQVDGLVDLLMNFDHYTRQRTSIRALLPPAQPAADTTASDTAQ